MKFLNKIEAVHPRGGQTRTKVERKKLSTQRKGDTFASKIDWIASTLSQMIEDYNYPPATNQLLHRAISLHSLITDSMSPDVRLKAYITFLELIETVGKEIQRLYQKGGLAPEVDRKLLHKFLGEVEVVSEMGGELLQALQKMQELRKTLDNLGLGGL